MPAGVPVGGDIEYADELTLGGAVVNRQEMKRIIWSFISITDYFGGCIRCCSLHCFQSSIFTIKRVAMNARNWYFDVFGMRSYSQIFPMDIGLGVWALTAILGPIPMLIAAGWVRLFKIGGPHDAYQS